MKTNANNTEWEGIGTLTPKEVADLIDQHNKKLALYPKLVEALDELLIVCHRNEAAVKAWVQKHHPQLIDKLGLDPKVALAEEVLAEAKKVGVINRLSGRRR